MRHLLSEVCPVLTASTTTRMAWITTGGVVDHDVVSRVRVGDVHRAGHERRELVLGRQIRSVDDRSEVRRCIWRQLTGLDELRDDIDELVAGREYDHRHAP